MKLKAEHIPWTKLHRRWDIRLYLMCAVPCYFWIQFVLRLNVQSWIRWPEVVQAVIQLVGGSAVIGVVLYSLVRFLIGDPLVDRRFGAAQYFQGEFPSGKIAERYSVEKAEARQLWRDYYDTWQFRRSVNFEKYLATTSAGYQCRAVVFLRVILVVLGAVGVVLVVVQEWSGLASLTRRVAFWLSIGYLTSAGLLFWWHRLPRGGKEPTGCWVSWRVRNEENLQTFVRDLKGRNIPEFWPEVTAKLEALRDAARGK